MTERELLYHAATMEDWAARTATHYLPAGYADEGFVHCSMADQLEGTLTRHYPERSGLVLLAIDPTALSSDVVREDLYGTGIEFPHVYGPIELAAVVSASSLDPS